MQTVNQLGVQAPAPNATIPQLAQSAAPGGGNDFWDISDNDFAGQQMPQDQEFSELVQIEKTTTGTHPALYLVLAVLLGVGGFMAYVIFVEERNPIEMVQALIEGRSDEPELAPTPLKLPKPKVARNPRTDTRRLPVAAVQPKKKAVEGNPYWALPNKIVGANKELGRFWSPEEEETFRAGLAHRYTYQRLKTVQDVRKLHLRGSDVILWDAMQDKKFWTRGFAAIGLAEQNVEVSLSTLEGMLTNARSELRADFFERFIRRPNAGQAYILRQVVRILDEKGRLIVLKGIERTKDPLRDLYMVAATKDPGKSVQRWVRDAMLRRGVGVEKYNELLEVVEGRASGGYLLTGGPAPRRVDSKMSDRVATDEELDKELSAFDDDGEVEFYDTTKKADKKPDPDTFEYEEE